MATFTVTTSADSVKVADGKLSLREALTLANANPNADTITFAAGLEGKTIALTKGQFDITSDVTITGDPDHDRIGVTIDQRTDNWQTGTYARLLEMRGTDTDASLSGLTMSGGSSNYSGGGIAVGEGGRLDLRGVQISDNEGWYGVGGGIYAAATSEIHLRECVLSDICAMWGGGAIASWGIVELSSCAVADNSAGGDGCGLLVRDQVVLQKHCD